MCLILQECQVNALGFDHLKEMYKNDPDSSKAYENPLSIDRSMWKEYMLQEGLLFKGSQLCIPKFSTREKFFQEKHNGGLV